MGGQRVLEGGIERGKEKRLRVAVDAEKEARI
jgi:hypothetical protein